jgi:hypothetical protein
MADTRSFVQRDQRCGRIQPRRLLHRRRVQDIFLGVSA